MPSTRSKLKGFIRAISQEDEAAVEAALRETARSHRALTPLMFLLGALMMLLRGLRLVIGNWRLLLLEVLPAMWIWAAMLDLKAHVIRGHSFHDWRGTTALLCMAGIVLVTMACYHLNVVFAYAIASPAEARLRPHFSRAGKHWARSGPVGLAVGAALAVSAVITPRWGLLWFSLSLSLVLAVMMVTYVALPARLLGLGSTAPRRDKLAAGLVSTAVSAAICTPAYMTGRIGVLLLGSHRLFVLGVILVCFGFSLQAGANGAIKAVEMSVKLVVGRDAEAAEAPRAAARSPI